MPRSIVALTGVLIVGMAAAIGVLLAPSFRGDPKAGAAPTPSASPGGKEKGRFAAEPPRACSLLDDKQLADLIANYRVSEVSKGECNWLNISDWTKPSTAKYDLRVRLVTQKPDGFEVNKAREFFTGRRGDVARTASTPPPNGPRDLRNLGEEAFMVGTYSKFNLYGGSYKVAVHFRTSNLNAEVQFEQGGVKEDKDGRIATGAEKVARLIADALKN
ncbi:hypothetical protein [Sinosporangium album]|uniref:hypothetical protein n=1 Tax=Sinosporangium album TaxID=504805 RepID=UPI00115FF6FA|nr:hypothetical protein [Sinosporangium album]